MADSTQHQLGGHTLIYIHTALIGTEDTKILIYPDSFTPEYFETKWLACGGDHAWKNRQIAEMSSIAMPRFLVFHARAAHPTSLLAVFFLSGHEETILTASWLEMTSHTWNREMQNEMKLSCMRIYIVFSTHLCHAILSNFWDYQPYNYLSFVQRLRENTTVLFNWLLICSRHSLSIRISLLTRVRYESATVTRA